MNVTFTSSYFKTIIWTIEPINIQSAVNKRSNKRLNYKCHFTINYIKHYDCFVLVRLIKMSSTIVISGVSGKFPNSHNVDELEHNLYNKVSLITLKTNIIKTTETNRLTWLTTMSVVGNIPTLK